MSFSLETLNWLTRREIKYNGIRHYIISFNEKVNAPIKTALSSANAERLTESEMLKLINNGV